MTKKAKEVEVENNQVFISMEEMINVIESINKYQSMVADVEKAGVEKALVDTAMKLFSAQFTLKKKELDDVNQNIKDINERIKNHQKAHEELREQIAEKYNLKKDWGYNPFTGEIAPDDVLS